MSHLREKPSPTVPKSGEVGGDEGGRKGVTVTCLLFAQPIAPNPLWDREDDREIEVLKFGVGRPEPTVKTVNQSCSSA